MKLSTINQIVQAIINMGEERGKADAENVASEADKERLYKRAFNKHLTIANEAAIYLRTALICEARGIDEAMEYFNGNHDEYEYIPFLTGVENPKDTR